MARVEREWAKEEEGAVMEEVVVPAGPGEEAEGVVVD